MRSATEDEQPVHLFQSAQLDLPKRTSLLQPPKAFFDEPAAAQTDRIAGLPRGSAIQVAAAALVVLRDMGRHVQLPDRPDEILRIVSLVGAHGDAAWTALLLLGQHQQRGIALCIAIGVCNHRRGDRPCPGPRTSETTGCNRSARPAAAQSGPRRRPAAAAPAECAPAQSMAGPNPRTVHLVRRSATAAPCRSASALPTTSLPEPARLRACL